MNSSTFLIRFGLDPNQFEDTFFDPEYVDGRWVYRAKVKDCPEHRTCPTCKKSDAAVINDRRIARLKCHLSDDAMDEVIIDKIRYFCRRCKASFTPELKGTRKGTVLSNATLEAIHRDLATMMTFAAIGKKYGIDEAYVIRIFDSKYRAVPRLPLPEILCIDEICFVDRIEGKYPAVLYDWRRREVVEIVQSRQKQWLERWFSEIPESERNSVVYYVSDMYDEYARIKKRFLPKAMHIVDLFHVVKLLAEAVKQLRTNAMNAAERDSPEYGFMKSKWKMFQFREGKIPAKYYTHRKTGVVYPNHEILMMCLKTSPALWEGWSCLQELYRYREYKTFTEAYAFVGRIADKLDSSGSPLLGRVAASYRKWRTEIANGLARNQRAFNPSNGVAEGLNNRLKTLKKISNGCTNFERFRKRILLILTYSKKDD